MKHPYATAIAVAEAAVLALRPHCARIQIAGSLRRRCPAVGDVEIVCIPKQEPEAIDLFTSVDVYTRGFCSTVEKWPRIKGSSVSRYTRRQLTPEIALDLFMARPENWGYILAIRTGSAAFSKRLALRWTSMGYHGYGGMLRKDSRDVPVREEADLFRLVDLPFIPPEARNA